ncbi:hypothetical protein V6N13_105041 [Hibiscus sabdariffa]|uniref:Uncharacterized protein n=2 Tax=Hibiscus sabdariffa TaxID=183260 RepID=A0ABR2SIS8_9ROSI
MMVYLQKKSLTDCCHDSTSISITKIAASPHDEPPILSTHVGSGDELSQALPPFGLEQEEGDDVVLMAIISPAKTIGRTNPELSFISCFLLRTTETEGPQQPEPMPWLLLFAMPGGVGLREYTYQPLLLAS